MAIVLSTILEDLPQSDGRRQIREVHRDSFGVDHVVAYLAETAIDATAALPGRAAAIDARLVEDELDQDIGIVLGDGNSPAPRYATAAQHYARLRAAFARANGLDAIRLARELAKLTDPQLRTLFGYTNAQTTALRSKLNSMINLAIQVRDQVGE